MVMVMEIKKKNQINQDHTRSYNQCEYDSLRIVCLDSIYDHYLQLDFSMNRSSSLYQNEKLSQQKKKES